MPGGKEAGASGTIYQLVTDLGSDKKQLFMTSLLKKGAVGSGAPVELLLGSPCKGVWISMLSLQAASS